MAGKRLRWEEDLLDGGDMLGKALLQGDTVGTPASGDEPLFDRAERMDAIPRPREPLGIRGEITRLQRELDHRDRVIAAYEKLIFDRTNQLDTLIDELRHRNRDLEHQVATLRDNGRLSRQIARDVAAQRDAALLGVAGAPEKSNRWPRHAVEWRGLGRVLGYRGRRIGKRFIGKGGALLSHVTFINGCPEGHSKRYRIDNIAEALPLCGIDVTVLDINGCAERLRTLTTDIIVIFRARFTPELGGLIETARARGIPVGFDIDDLVFEPESVDFIGACRDMPEEEKDWHRREVARFRQTLEMCDFATVTTKFLAGRVECVGVPAFVVRNTINHEQLAVATLEPVRKARLTTGKCIAYFCGSPTHNRDFLAAADALANILRDFPGTTLHIIGELELGDQFRDLGAHIRFSPHMHHLDMLSCMRGADVIIAPLELENPFTAGKSELKIFESALMRVPCVASAVDSYSQCIESGHNGFLCKTSTEWYQALATLLRDENRNKAIWQAARRKFLTDFYILSNICEIIELYEMCITRYNRTA